MEATATTQALSEPAREFLERGPGRHFIGGEWLESADGASFETIDPATGRRDHEVAQGGPEDVDRAVAAAREALEGELGSADAARSGPALIWALGRGDQGEPAPSWPSSSRSTTASRSPTRKGDMAAAVNHLRYYAGWPTKIEGETIPVSARRTSSATPARSRSASAGRSSPGTSRC